MMVKSHQKGLTLPELMIGIVLFAILTSMAVPSFQNLMRRQELRAQVGLFNSTLAFARNEAITRKENVVLCGSSDGATCLAGTDWSSGWLVYVDSDEDAVLDNDELILRSGGVAGGSSSLNVENAAPLAIQYNAAGESEAGVSKLYLCAGNASSGADTDRSRTISISNVGSARVAKGATCPSS